MYWKTKQQVVKVGGIDYLILGIGLQKFGNMFTASLHSETLLEERRIRGWITNVY